MALSIQPASTEPIYRQIAGQIGRMIASGQLPIGEALPSVREVAGVHAINPMTVSRAYSLLEAEGVLERLRGKGMVVAAAERQVLSTTGRIALIDPLLRELVRQARELELADEVVVRRLCDFLGE